MSPDQRLSLAFTHHRAGRFAEAEGICGEILESHPGHAGALHLSGVIAGQRGDVDRAIDLIQQSIRAKPDFAEAYRNLATLLAVRGGFAQAAAEYQKALEAHPTDCAAHRDLGVKFAANPDFQAAATALSAAVAFNPRFAEAQNDLGTILSILNRLDEAIAAHSSAVKAKPSLAEAHYSLGNALSRKDRIDEALAAYRFAIRVRRNYAEAYLNIGNLLRRRGQLTDAIAAYKKAIEVQPYFKIAAFNLGQAYRSAGVLDEALAAFHSALQIDPAYGDAFLMAAVVLADLQQFDDSLAAHARGASLMPDSAMPHDVRGQIALLQGDAAEAARHFRRAIEIDPTLETAWNGLGVALQSQGNFEEAARCFRKKLELTGDAEIGRGYINLTNAGQLDPGIGEIEKLRRLLDDPNSPTDNRVGAGFALGKILDNTDRYEEAFAAYAKANLLWKQLRESLNDRYDPDAAREQVDRTIATFNRDFFSKHASSRELSELPVFVVGMPRSGTTLIQQIAASHPQVHGAGELKNMGAIAGQFDLNSLKSQAASYLHRLSALNPSASRVIDKTPANIQLLGQIALLLPGARVIFCRRDAMNTCLSCYFQWFTQGNLFSFDLLHCGHEYLQTDRLREHWLKTLPLKMLEVKYEELVVDLESQSHRLIEFLGLPWDSACLDFHRAKSIVLTASAWQVRQPIYTKSIGRWRHYERHLGALKSVIDRPK